MDFIFIEEFKVKARVGIYPRERVMEQMLELNLTLGIPDISARQDDIDRTIDYAKVIQRIRHELNKRQFNLIETLGEFLVQLLFDEFNAPWVKIRIAKIGVMNNVRRVGVFIQRGQKGVVPPETFV